MLRGNPIIDRHYIQLSGDLMRTIPPSRLAFAVPGANSDASGIAPSTTELDDVESNVSTQAPYNEYEDIVSVQFSSICSPFLATTHVPCSQAGHIRTTPH